MAAGSPEVADALLLESGCAAEIAIMGALLDWPRETDRIPEEMASANNLVQRNLGLGRLPLMDPIPEGLPRYRADIRSRLCTGAFMYCTGSLSRASPYMDAVGRI